MRGDYAPIVEKVTERMYKLYMRSLPLTPERGKTEQDVVLWSCVLSREALKHGTGP